MENLSKVKMNQMGELLGAIFELEDSIMEFGIDCHHSDELIDLAREILNLELENRDKVALEEILAYFIEYNDDYGPDSDNFYKLWNTCMDILSRAVHPTPDDPIID
jgi:hypothetical protein